MATNILITGVSRGIGHGLARYYLQRGEQVYGISRNCPDDLSEFENMHFRSLDVTDSAQIPVALDELLEGVSSLDLAILNAGILGQFGDLAVTPMEEIETVMNVNLWANKRILDHLLSSLSSLQQVVTISSGAAVNGNRGWGAYAISKASLNMMTKLYATETPHTHFCAFAPGIVDTHMQDVLCGKEPDERYPSLDVLRSKRFTQEMPNAETAAEKLATAFAQLPDLVESGDFADIRKLSVS